MEDSGKKPKGVVHSKVIKAGKRTYFVDVRQTQNEDYYLSLTESTKKHHDNRAYYVRNKILIYKEDFDKVQEGLNEMIDLIKNELMADYNFNDHEDYIPENSPKYGEEDDLDEIM
ncbi:DUF3276 family protein [bacterium]|nr:DUF3276 family protein [bacterium]